MAEIYVKPGVSALLTGVDTLVFDIDGVLMDTSASYPAAVAQIIDFYFRRLQQWPGEARLFRPEECALFKVAGGFNDDWVLAGAVVYFYLAKSGRLGTVNLDVLRHVAPSLTEYTQAIARLGGGMTAARQVADKIAAGLSGPEPAAAFDQELITRLGCEIYGGIDGCQAMFGIEPRYIREPGLFNLEKPLLDLSLLRAGGCRVGIYTGRILSEATVPLTANGLGPWLRSGAVCAADGPYRKPDPGGLRHLAGLLGSRKGLFVGDNIDDFETVRRYRAEGGAAPPFFFAGILGGALGDETETIFRSLDADMIAPDVNAVLRWLGQPAQ